MARETCIQCERIFIENQSVWDFDNFFDWKINEYPEFWEMCVKCYIRIMNRYLTK